MSLPTNNLTTKEVLNSVIEGILSVYIVGRCILLYKFSKDDDLIYKFNDSAESGMGMAGFNLHSPMDP